MANSEASFAGSVLMAFGILPEEMHEEIHPLATIRILVNAKLIG